VRVARVSTLVAVTIALANAAPFASVTVPEMALEVPLCASNNSRLTTDNMAKRMYICLSLRV
jgi:hypothetical protein